MGIVKPTKTKNVQLPKKNHVDTNFGNSTTDLRNIKLEETTNLFNRIETTKDNYDYMQNLDKNIQSLMAKSDLIIRVAGIPRKAYTCTICGKEGQGRNIKNHIETHHMEGISIPCNFCDESFKSRMSLFSHMRKAHK